MSLLDDLKTMRGVVHENWKSHQTMAYTWQECADEAQTRLLDLDTAIAALEPAPEYDPASLAHEEELAPALADPLSAELRSDPGSEENAGTNSDVPAGFTKWEGGEWTGNPRAVVQVLFESGDIAGGSDVVEDRASWWTWTWDGTSDRIIAYRVVSEPAEETHTDDVRTAEGETVASGSVLDDPDLKAAVQRGHDLLAQAGVTTLAYDSAAEPAYVGLQDAQLDADWDAMKERQEAGRKLHFSIFGKREEV